MRWVLLRESQLFRSLHCVCAHNQGSVLLKEQEQFAMTLKTEKLKGYEGGCPDLAGGHFNSSREDLQFQESDHTGEPCLPGYNRHAHFYF